MKKNKKVSIIIPAYNAEDKIARCIDSILNQTYKNFEVIIVDDGSSDKTKNICEEYLKIDNRINLFSKCNGGVSSARNYGLDNANGDFITFVDCDDTIEVDYLETLTSNSQDVDLIIANFKNIFSFKDLAVVKSKAKEYEKIKIELNEFFIENLNYALVGKFPVRNVYAKLFLTSIIKRENIRFKEDLFIGEDYLFVLEYIKNCKRDIYFINKPIYNYFQYRSSITKKYQPSMLLQFKLLMQEVKKIYGNSFIKIENAFKNFYISNIFSVLKNLLTFCKGKEVNLKLNEIYSFELLPYLLKDMVSLNFKVKIGSKLLKMKSNFLIKLFFKIYNIKKQRYFEG